MPGSFQESIVANIFAGCWAELNQEMTLLLTAKAFFFCIVFFCKLKNLIGQPIYQSGFISYLIPHWNILLSYLIYDLLFGIEAWVPCVVKKHPNFGEILLTFSFRTTQSYCMDIFFSLFHDRLPGSLRSCRWHYKGCLFLKILHQMLTQLQLSSLRW